MWRKFWPRQNCPLQLPQEDHAEGKLTAFSRIAASFWKQRVRNLVLFSGQLEALATRQWTLLEASHHMRTEAALPFTICSYTEPSRSATPRQLTIAKVSCLEAIAQSITMMYFISAPRNRKIGRSWSQPRSRRCTCPDGDGHHLGRTFHGNHCNAFSGGHQQDLAFAQLEPGPSSAH